MIDVILEVAFGKTPFDALSADDWVDISDWGISAEPLRGQEAELDEPSAGTMQVVLDNSDRDFDTSYADGPFFGLMLVDTPIRLRIDLGDTAGFCRVLPWNEAAPTIGGVEVVSGDVLERHAGSASGDYVKLTTDGDFIEWTFTLTDPTDFNTGNLKIIGQQYVDGTPAHFDITINGHTYGMVNDGAGGTGALWPEPTANVAGPWQWHEYISDDIIDDAPFVVGTNVVRITMTALNDALYGEIEQLVWGKEDFTLEGGPSGDLIRDGVTFSCKQQILPIWSGFVESWPSSYSAGGLQSEVDLSCSDAIRVFGETTFNDADINQRSTTAGRRIVDILSAIGWTGSEGGAGHTAEYIEPGELPISVVGTTVSSVGPPGPPGTPGNSVMGPTGATGPAGPPGVDGIGVSILGSYDTEAELVAAHPTGSIGDAYLVDGDLYVWSETTGLWNNVGNIQGPTGATGPTGVAGTVGATGPAGADFTPTPTTNWDQWAAVNA